MASVHRTLRTALAGTLFWLRQTGEGPIFLRVHYYETHSPYRRTSHFRTQLAHLDHAVVAEYFAGVRVPRVKHGSRGAEVREQAAVTGKRATERRLQAERSASLEHDRLVAGLLRNPGDRQKPGVDPGDRLDELAIA